jgi:hypothetical protein
MTRYLLIQNGDVPMGDWAPADIRAHLDYQRALNEALVDDGELVDAQGVAARATLVRSDGRDTRRSVTPALLAGYRIVDVESEERAIEIAARVSAAPGPDGEPLQHPVEVREVMVPEL